MGGSLDGLFAVNKLVDIDNEEIGDSTDLDR